VPPKPAKNSLPAADVRGFRAALDAGLATTFPGTTNQVSDTRYGVYAFYDYETEPIYVGQTNEKLRVRIRRHLTNQRTDAVGMRVLDPFEIRYVEMWPLVQAAALPVAEAKVLLNRLERTIYERAIAESKFGVILNEKLPPAVPLLAANELPAPTRFEVVPPAVLAERQHADIRIARRAQSLSRLSDVARERGEVTPGLRRVIVVQAVRLAWLAAQRLAYVEGREPPTYTEVLDLPGLVGTPEAGDDEGETLDDFDDE
jgi:hypothetical protein